MVASNSLFLSYRRTVGFAWARLVWDDLTEHGIDAFLDLESIRDAGHFDTKILHQIEARPYFVPVLVEGTLDRCADPDDWLRREIEHAVANDRSFVPLIVAGFDFEEAERSLSPAAYRAIRTSNGVPLMAEFFGEAMRRLREDRLKPVELPTRTPSPEDQAFAAEAQQRALRATIELPVIGPRPQPSEGRESGPNAVSGPVGASETVDSPEGDESSAEDDVSGQDLDTPPVIHVAPTKPHDSPSSSASRKSRWVDTHRRSVVSLAAVVVVGLAGIAAAQLLRGDDESSETTGSRAVTTVRQTDGTITTGTITTTVDSTGSVTTTRPGSADDLGPIIADGNGLNEGLRSGRKLSSAIGGHELGLAANGALLVTTDSVPWVRQPARVDGQQVVGGDFWSMQRDGNLVLYTDDGEALWSSKTDDRTREERDDRVALVLEHDQSSDEGVLEIRVNGDVIWTCRPEECPIEPQQNPLPAPAPPATETTSPGPETSSTAPEPVITPDVRGLTETQATAQLRELGFEVEPPQRQRDRAPAGIVIEQSIPPGEEVDTGAPITLTIGAGSGTPTTTILPAPP